MSLKFNCSNTTCRARIEVEDALAGTEVICPKCSITLRVPSSHDIRFNCATSECGQPLVVDVSEAGRFLKCPACGKPQRIPGDPPKSVGGDYPSRNVSKVSKLSAMSPERFVRRFKHEDQLVAWFFVVTLAILLIIGFSQLATLFLKPGYPGGIDKVSGLKRNSLMMVLGLLECSLAVWCAWVSSVRFAAVGLLLFAGNWWVWQIAQINAHQHPRQYFPAAGALGDSLGISALASDRLMMLFMLNVAVGCAFVLWRQGRLEKAEGRVRVSDEPKNKTSRT